MIVHPSYGDGDSKTKNQQEKPLSFSSIRPVPETDTGGREENSKVLERFMAKELGKIDLQLREKGHRSNAVSENRSRRLFNKNTGLCKIER